MKTHFKGILIPAFLSMIACVISFTLSFGQGGPSLETGGPIVDEMIPPSPEAAAFGKYGAIPVSQYSGIPNISIPLYSLQYKGISVPIDLSYHAGGFRVSEDASRVGLGWTVNAGGLISRNVRGTRDEEYQVGYSNLASSGYNIDCSDQDLVEAAAGENGVDAQPDQFSLNFLGNSGKFVFTTEGDIKMLSCNSLLELVPTVDAGNIVSWTVRDANGFVYTFSEYERSKNHAVTYNSSNPGGGSGTYTEWVNTSWYLTEIRSPLHDVINLEYEEITPSVPYRDVAISESSYHLNSSSPAGADCPESYYKTISANHMMRWIKLVSIHSPFTRIDFEDGINREDITGTSSLGKIVVKDKKSLQNIKAIEFNQGHFQATGCNTLDECYRLKLNDIVMIGYDEQQQAMAGEIYLFDYNPTQLPARTSLEQDHWGFYNANGQNGGQNPTLLPAMTINNNLLSGAIREPNASKMQACMLTSIQYPTGGRTEFTFEPHTYSRSGGQVFAPKTGGGLRIKQIKNISNHGNPDEITEYDYIDKNNPSYSSGKLNTPLDYTYERTVWSEYNEPNGIGGFNVVQKECNYTIRESSSHIPIMNTAGSTVGYDRVEEKKLSSTNPNGKTVSYFYSAQDYPDVYLEIDPDHYSKFFIFRNNEWRRGLMEKQEVFDESGFLLQETDYEYAFPICETVTGLSSSIFKARLLLGPGVQDEFFCHTFEEEIGWARLDQTISKTYTAGNSDSFVENTTNYTYNGKGQARSSYMVNSDGNLHTSEAYYAGEDDPNNPGTKLGIVEMWNSSNTNYKHILAPVVFSRKLTNGVVQSESRVEFNYNANADIVLQDQQKVYPSPGIPNPLTTQYFYDDEGLITGSQQNGGPGTSILRSREKGLVSAKVTNALYEDVAYTSFDCGVDKDPSNGYRRIEGRWEFTYPNDPAGPNNSGGGWSSIGAKTGIGQFDFNTQRELVTSVQTGGKYVLSFWAKNNNPVNITVPSSLVLTETANDGWKLYIYELDLNPGQSLVLKSNHSGTSYIDELRLHPKYAHMTSVCYDLKLRTHTMTDANNRSIKYTYDAFGRLIQVRDHNGNLLSENEYFYWNH